MNSPYASLAQSARSQELKKARTILWIIGLLTLAVQTFMFLNSQKELDTAFDEELRKEGGSLVAMRALPAANRAEFDSVYTKALGQVRLIYGAGIVLGVIFIFCALCVQKKPVAATVTGLVLYLGSMAVQLAIDPKTIVQGIIIKVLIIAGLVSSVKAALAVEKERRAQAPG